MLAAVALAGCHRKPPQQPPPRLETPVQLPEATSSIVVPITARLSDLERSINREMPLTLWSIDRVEDRCVPAQRLKLFGKRVKVMIGGITGWADEGYPFERR